LKRDEGVGEVVQKLVFSTMSSPTPRVNHALEISLFVPDSFEANHQVVHIGFVDAKKIGDVFARGRSRHYFFLDQLLMELVIEESLKEPIGPVEAVQAVHPDHSSLQFQDIISKVVPLEEAKLFEHRIELIQHLKNFC
jgi:hypothetical protein